MSAGIRWHVQTMGTGPVALLVHGTGAASHSWRGLMPLLASRFTVIAVDLPGHGFTGAAPDATMSLPGMASALNELMQALQARPALAAGHSAGAAILARMCLDGMIDPALLCSVNGALLPLNGLAGQLFSPIAKLLSRASLIPELFSLRASNRQLVERLLRGTGSKIDDRGVSLYALLMRNSAHAGAALQMMAGWDLWPLQRDLPHLAAALCLIAGENDQTISPQQSRRVQALLAGADLCMLPGLGHLAHEEAPDAVAQVVLSRFPVQ
jgi:magnesium chelatase accessory protein